MDLKAYLAYNTQIICLDNMYNQELRDATLASLSGGTQNQKKYTSKWVTLPLERLF